MPLSKHSLCLLTAPVIVDSFETHKMLVVPAQCLPSYHHGCSPLRQQLASNWSPLHRVSVSVSQWAHINKSKYVWVLSSLFKKYGLFYNQSKTFNHVLGCPALWPSASIVLAIHWLHVCLMTGCYIIHVLLYSLLHHLSKLTPTSVLISQCCLYRAYLITLLLLLLSKQYAHVHGMHKINTHQSMPNIVQVPTPTFWITMVLDSYGSLHTCTAVSSQLCADWNAKWIRLCVYDKTRQEKTAYNSGSLVSAGGPLCWWWWLPPKHFVMYWIVENFWNLICTYCWIHF